MEDLYVEIQNAADKIASPNWAAQMSAITSLFAVVFALAAMIVTIIVARKQNKIAEQQNSVAQEQAKISQKQAEITEQQNRIALFEKRYELYTIVVKCKNFGQFLKIFPFTDNKMFQSFLSAFDSELFHNKTFTENDTAVLMLDLVFKLGQGKFLFLEDVGEYTQKLADSLRDLFMASQGIDYELYIGKIQAFLKATEAFEESGVLKKMDKELQMQSDTIWRK